ncbi:MAG: AmmeMemoRadiSam system protein A [Roseovarius sp.]
MNRQTDISARPSAVAGRFFPGEAEELARTVAECLAHGTPAASPPKAIISPHAGYPFSGHLAGMAWCATETARPARIAILSPSHQHAFTGIALPSQDRYAMPGFDLAIDTAARDMLVNRDLVHVENAAHDREHGVETQLPFQHQTHSGTPVVPLVIGRAPDEQVAQTVDALAALGDTLFILSSDLSHFLTLHAAREHDAKTAKLIETAKPEDLTGAHACGAAAIRGFLLSDHGQGSRLLRLGMANSAAVTKDTTRTVGYGAWALFDVTDAILHADHRTALLKAARQALTSHITKCKLPHVETDSFAPPLQGHGASFVTLQKDGKLRGCIGSLTAHQPLIADVIENTRKSATEDPRFPPVTTEELDHITLKIAVLSPSEPMPVKDEADLLARLEPGRDGLILSDKGRRGVFLPMVWDSLPAPEAFLAALKQKAGLPRDHWSDRLQFRRFCAESFAEADYT